MPLITPGYCTNSRIFLNEGVGVTVHEELTIARLRRHHTSNRVFQAVYLRPVPRRVPRDEHHPSTTTIKYEFGGVGIGSYCDQQQADQIVFVTDHFQYLKVVNDADGWVDSFSSDTEETDVMTCFRLKDKKQPVCDFRFQYNWQ